MDVWGNDDDNDGRHIILWIAAGVMIALVVLGMVAVSLALSLAG